MAPALSTKERVHKAFSEIDNCKNVLNSYVSEWKDLEAYISEIEKSLQLKLEELAEKEKAFDEKNDESAKALDKRDETISTREQASLARVQEQRDAALVALEDERCKYFEDGKPKTTVTATKSGDAAPASKIANGAAKEKAKSAAGEVRPEIKTLCENMDGEGLVKYIVDHRKEIGSLRNEMPLALQSVIDPSRLVLKALEGYHLLERDPSHAKETGASANRRACILLLECLAQVLADPVLGVDSPVVPSNIKDSAKEVANLWRSKRDVHADAANDNSLDAQSFLQLLATFGIASEFNDDELLKLVSAVARRKQTPALCRSLGLTAKIPDLVNSLNKDGKQIEALNFAHFFGIMDQIQPAQMLKAYLKEARKGAQSLAKNAANPAAAQNESLMKELSAVKAVLRAIEEYNLAAEYPSEPLKRRVEQLEKAKADRKKVATVGKTTQPQSKKRRLSGSQGGPATSDRGRFGAAAISSHGPGSQTAYERRPQSSYRSFYGVDSRGPGSLSYPYSANLVGPSVYSASAYSNPSAYGSYQYGDELLSASAYAPSYFH